VNQPFDESIRCPDGVNLKRINDGDNRPGWNSQDVRRRRCVHRCTRQDRLVWMIEDAPIVTIGWHMTDRVSLGVLVDDGMKMTVDVTFVDVLRRNQRDKPEADNQTQRQEAGRDHCRNPM
jgi:hypothetical protein